MTPTHTHTHTLHPSLLDLPSSTQGGAGLDSSSIHSDLPTPPFSSTVVTGLDGKRTASEGEEEEEGVLSAPLSEEEFSSRSECLFYTSRVTWFPRRSLPRENACRRTLGSVWVVTTKREGPAREARDVPFGLCVSLLCNFFDETKSTVLVMVSLVLACICHKCFTRVRLICVAPTVSCLLLCFPAGLRCVK